MLALRPSQKSSGPDEPLARSCTPNVVPFRIHYDGAVKTQERHWNPIKDEKEDNWTAYFRGRKLRGRTVQLPEGYQGIVAVPTDRTLPTPKRDDKVDDDALPEEPVKILEAQATFDNFVVWDHENVPAADEAFVKGVEEWIKLAEAMHEDSPNLEKAAQ